MYGRYIFALTGLALVVYFAVYTWIGNLQGIIIESPDYVSFRWFYLFQVMLLGGYCADSSNLVCSRRRDCWLMVLFLIAYYAYKGACLKYGFYWGQLLIPVFLIGTIYYTYKVLLGIWLRKAGICSFLQKCSKPLIFISTLTLDIYLVQFVVIRFFSDYEFPLGFIGATVFILVGAVILNRLSRLFYGKIMTFIQERLFLKNVDN